MRERVCVYRSRMMLSFCRSHKRRARALERERIVIIEEDNVYTYIDLSSSGRRRERWRRPRIASFCRTRDFQVSSLGCRQTDWHDIIVMNLDWQIENINPDKTREDH